MWIEGSNIQSHCGPLGREKGLKIEFNCQWRIIYSVTSVGWSFHKTPKGYGSESSWVGEHMEMLGEGHPQDMKALNPLHIPHPAQFFHLVVPASHPFKTTSKWKVIWWVKSFSKFCLISQKHKWQPEFVIWRERRSFRTKPLTCGISHYLQVSGVRSELTTMMWGKNTHWRWCQNWSLEASHYYYLEHVVDFTMSCSWANALLQRIYQVLWVELCPPQKIEVLTPSTCECDLIWK